MKIFSPRIGGAATLTPTHLQLMTMPSRKLGEFEVEDLGGGVLVFRNAVKGDTEEVFKYIDAQSEVSHQNRWEYIVGEDGEKYGINEDGFRYRPEDIPATPVRLLHPVTEETPDVPREFFHNMEDTIYKALIRYIDYFPLIVGCVWWKNRGHILRYADEGILGAHCDNDTNYKVTEGVRYMPRGQMAARQTCGCLVYLNDSVDSEDELDGTNFTGGVLEFFHLGIEYKPKKGDIVFFPTNYMASHQVSRNGCRSTIQLFVVLPVRVPRTKRLTLTLLNLLTVISGVLRCG